MIFSSIDALGYAASLLTLVTFAQKAMLPMRIMAVGANICFIGYGAMGQFMPVLILHLILLPINLARLRLLLRRSDCEADRSLDKAISKSTTAGASSGLL